MSGNIRCRVGDSSWINKDPNAPGISKNMRRNIIYFQQMARATPKWSDNEKVKTYYRLCKRFRNIGYNFVVDHMVPLNNRYVCGLHCPANLQIIDYRTNEEKSNHAWPDQWEEQLELF